MPPSSSSKPSKQPISISIQILAPSDRHNHPYNSANNVQPRHSFTLRLLPRTSIRELCLHAGDWVRLHGSSAPSAPLSSSSSSSSSAPLSEVKKRKKDEGINSMTRSLSLFEARDRDGHAFDATETVADALMAGETLYLIEKNSGGGGGGGETRRGARGDGVLRSLRADAARRSRAEVRTPSVASTSRSRSRSSKKVGSEPRKTPSQRALEIASQAHRAPSSSCSRSEPRRGRALVASSARWGGSPRRRLGEVGDSGVAAELVHTIEGSPPPPPPSRSLSRNSRVSSRKPTDEDRDADGDSSSRQRQQEGDKAPVRLIKTIEKSPYAEEPRQEHDAPAQAAEQDDVSSKAVASQQSLPSPTLSPSLLPQNVDSQLIIPDSQDPPTPPPPTQLQSKPAILAAQDDVKMARRSRPDDHFLSSELGKKQHLSQTITNFNHADFLSDARDKPAQRPASASKNDSFNTSDMEHKLETTRPSSSTAPRTVKSPVAPTRPSSSAFYSDLRPQRTKPAHKPDPGDPYDMVTDDESHSPRRDSFLRSSTRRLGSAAKRAPTPAVARNSLLVAREQPPSASHAEDAAKATIPSTPLAVAPRQKPTPVVHAGPSSPPAPLPPSPTDLVAAVLSRARQQPQKKKYILIEESDVEADGDEHVLHDAQNRFSSSRQQPSSRSASEAALPWSAPPLRLGLEEDAFWPARVVGRRAPVSRKESAGQEHGEEMDAKADIRKLVELDKKNAAAMVGSGKSKQEPQRKTDVLASTALVSPEKRQAKNAWQATPGKSPVLLIHGSSSSEEGVEEIGWVETGQKPSPMPRETASSPFKNVVAHDTRSQDESDGKGQEPTQVADPLMSDDAAVEPLSLLHEDDGIDLPAIEEPVFTGPASQKDSIRWQTEPSPPRETPKTDPITATDLNETPPSAQVSKRAHQQPFKEHAQASEKKRKHRSGEDPEPEDERKRKKRLRREARDALKAERRQRFEAEEAHREAERARLEEERKRLALERAQIRAKELEIIVSSPLKAAKMGLVLSDDSDGDQDEDEDEAGDGGDDSPLKRRRGDLSLGGLGDSSEEEDNNDSLSSREGDGRPSWRELSRRHFSASPQGSRDEQIAGDGAGAVLPPSCPAKQRIVRQGGPGEVGGAKEQQLQQQQFLRSQLNDWPFLEGPPGRGVYSPLEVHNRVHLRMVHASLQDMCRPAEEEAGASHSVLPESSQASPNNLNKTHLAKRKRKKSNKLKAIHSSPPHEPAEGKEEGQGLDTSPRSVRSPAPSPKDMAVAPAQEPEEVESKQQHQQGGAGAGAGARKNQTRRTKDNKRKQRRRKRTEAGLCKSLVRSVMYNTGKK